MTLSLHINFNGSCREAFEFYQAVLNGKIGHMLAYKDSPVKQQTPKHWHDKILHGNICISGIQIAGADILPEHYQAINGVNLLIGLDSVNEVKRVHEQLAIDGETIMPPQQTFWSPCYAIVVDRFNVPWKINCSDQ